MIVLSKMISGLGSAASSIYKELYKILKAHMTDRVMSVRVATVNVGYLKFAVWVYSCSGVSSQFLLCFCDVI